MRTATLLFLALVPQAWSCELPISSTESLTLQQANADLTATLLETSTLKPDPENIDRIDCYLAAVGKPKLVNMRMPLRELGQAIKSATSVEQKRNMVNRLNQSIARDAGSGFVLFPGKNGANIEINLFADLVEANCGAQPTQVCADNTELAKKLWWIAGEYRGYANRLNQADKTASLAYVDKLDAQWRSYKDDSIQLWPQEVLLNSLFYSPAKQGLSAPPNYKLLTLRPSLGLSYLSDEPHRIQPTVNVDLLGIYWWRYGPQDRAYRAGPGRGISASLIWSGDDTALGLTYHHNPKWSVTLAHGDENDVVLSISFQFAHWLPKK